MVDEPWTARSRSRRHLPTNPRPPLVRAPSSAVPEATNTLTSNDAYRGMLVRIESCRGVLDMRLKIPMAARRLCLLPVLH